MPDQTFIRTRTGRTYHVLSVRVQQRGKHAGRQHLRVLVCAPDVVLADDADVRELWWYRRG